MGVATLRCAPISTPRASGPFRRATAEYESGAGRAATCVRGAAVELSSCCRLTFGHLAGVIPETLERPEVDAVPWVRVSAVACLMLLALTPTLAAAEGQDSAAASALFDEGKAALDREDFAVACPKLAESYRLDPAPGALFYAADCEERRGRLATAWAMFRQLDETMAADDGRRDEVRQRLSTLTPRVPHVVVSIAKPVDGELSNPHVTRDGVELKAASLDTSIPIDPGAHTFAVWADGRARTEKVVDVREGESLNVSLDLGGRVSSAPPTPPSAPSKARMIGGVTTAVFGLGGMIAGAVMGGIAKSSYDDSDGHCNDDDRCDQTGVDIRADARALGDAGTVVFFVGVAAVVTGAIVWFTAPKENGGFVGAVAAPTRVGLAIAPTGVSLVGSFQ